MLLTTITDFIKQHGVARRYYIAYSGGLDSHVLLVLTAALRAQLAVVVKAIHVNHNLSPHAQQWQQHCHEVCAALAIELISVASNCQPPAGESLENYARLQRYQQFKQLLAPADMLLTAHHQDDQAETLLLQLMRGTGLRGLSAMPQIRSLGKGCHGRPLLAVPRAQIKAYALANGLKWVEDELNTNLKYPRNYLRHVIMPQLQQLWPATTTTLCRTAQHCAAAQQLLDTVAAADLATCSLAPGILTVSGLLALPPSRQKLVLRLWLQQQQVLLPSTTKLQQILTTVLPAHAAKQPRLVWGEVQVWRYQQRLYLLPATMVATQDLEYRWDCQQPLIIPEVGILSVTTQQGLGLRVRNEPIIVKFWHQATRYTLPNGQHQQLKKLWQAQRVPPWLRCRIPLIYIANELAAIPGYLMVAKFKAPLGCSGWHFKFAPYRYQNQNGLYYPDI